MIQKALTVIVPIQLGEVKALRDVLTAIGDDIEGNSQLSWQSSPSTHFARFVILDGESPGGSDGRGVPSLKNTPPRLLFTSNYDGDLESYLQELVSKFGADMEPIWSKCENYAAGACSDVARFTKFILEHSHLKRDAPPEAFYIACRGVSVQEIWRSLAIREALNVLLDLPETQQLLRNPSNLVPRSAPVAAPPKQQFKLIGLVGGWLGSLAEWIIGIRGVPNPNLPVNSPAAQLAIEDRVTQNQITVIVPVRADFKARILLPIVLKAVNAQSAQSTGSLSGLTTIHFARWAIIDNGKNLFFESNFDGSWENYIDDFVDRASLGMNLIWGNCIGFPSGGCKDIEWFKKYIRDNQIPAQMFYSAYPNSSIKNNLNDLQLARAVQRLLSAAEVEELLHGTYRLTEGAFKQLMSEPATALFLSGSYNRGVAKALNTPLQTNPQPAKKSALALGFLAGAGLLAFWLMHTRQS